MGYFKQIVFTIRFVFEKENSNGMLVFFKDEGDSIDEFNPNFGKMNETSIIIISYHRNKCK